MISDTTFHESGHIFFSYIFQDLMYINLATINPGEYGKGGVNISLLKQDNELTDIDHFSLVIVHLSGLVVEYASRKNNTNVNYENIINYLVKRIENKSKKVDSFDGDFENLSFPIKFLMPIQKCSEIEILSNAVIIIAKFLEDKGLWNYIQLIAQELETNKELNFEQIDSLFRRCGYKKYIKLNKPEIIIFMKNIMYN